jgi:hypothetical protein
MCSKRRRPAMHSDGSLIIQILGWRTTVQLAEVGRVTEGLEPDVKQGSSRRPRAGTNWVLGIPFSFEIWNFTSTFQGSKKLFELISKYLDVAWYTKRLLRHLDKSTGKQQLLWKFQLEDPIQDSKGPQEQLQLVTCGGQRQLPTYKTTYLVQDSYTTQDNNNEKP